MFFLRIHGCNTARAQGRYLVDVAIRFLPFCEFHWNYCVFHKLCNPASVLINILQLPKASMCNPVQHVGKTDVLHILHVCSVNLQRRVRQIYTSASLRKHVHSV